MSLLQAGRQLSMDVRAAVQEARTRTATLTIQVKTDRYLIYIEGDNPPDGYQEDETLIVERPLEKGVTFVADAALPSSWGTDLHTLQVGDLVDFSGMGFRQQTVAVFSYDEAPAYQTVCTRIYNSGDSDVYRYDSNSARWLPAPLR